MSNSVNVNALLTGAVDEGNLGAGALNILQGIDDIGNRIQAGLGVAASSVAAPEVILVRIRLDDSPSMDGDPQVAAMQGYNLAIDALSDSKQKSGILFGADFLNGGPICPYLPIDQAVRLNNSNYHLRGLTPLYDQSLVTLGTVLAKAQEFSDNGVPVRTVTLIVTDGFDNNSRATAGKVKAVVQDMLKAENHIIAGMGICERTRDAAELARRQNIFKQVFGDMGIPANWILTPDNSQSEIRKAFAVFSNSAVRASQNAANFSSSVAGGFGS